MMTIGKERVFLQDQEEVVRQKEDPVDASVEELRHRIREKLLDHLQSIGLTHEESGESQRSNSKEAIRAYHAVQRAEYRMHECQFVRRYGEKLLHHFADGSEIDPSAIDPVLLPVMADSKESNLFRLSTLLWSVPVSRGYGR